MPSRRRFLAASAATITAAALPRNIFAEQPEANVFTNASLGAYSQGLLTQANFAKVVGSAFTVQHADGSYGTMTLRSAENVVLGANAPAKPVPVARISVNPVTPVTQVISTFEAVFDVQGPALAQDTYLLDHGTLGSFAAFLVPGISPTTGTPSALATFSYLTNEPITAPAPRPLRSFTAAAPGSAARSNQ